MFNLKKEIENGCITNDSTDYIYGYMASDIWQRTIQITREACYCHFMGYSFQLAARDILHAPSDRQAGN